MDEKVEMIRRIPGGREVRVEITPEGEVRAFGASRIYATFPYVKTEDGLKIHAGSDARTFSAELGMGGMCNGVEAIFRADNHLMHGRPCGLFFFLEDGKWQIRARDGIGDWNKDFALRGA